MDDNESKELTTIVLPLNLYRIKTEHPQILKTFENGIESGKLNDVVAEIKILCEEQNPDGIIKLLQLYIEGYADNINGVV